MVAIKAAVFVATSAVVVTGDAATITIVQEARETTSRKTGCCNVAPVATWGACNAVILSWVEFVAIHASRAIYAVIGTGRTTRSTLHALIIFACDSD